MKACYGFVLVFDLTSARSLEELKIFVEQITRIKFEENKAVNGNHFPAVLVGNKSDLPHQMTEKDVANFMKKELNINVPIYFTSALNRVNVDETFEGLIKEMRIFKAKQTPTEEKKGGLFSSISAGKDADNDLKNFNEIN